ncbi:MAG: hypothetical protein ABSG68_16300 [Thermoguttaceae bacterium]
MIAWSCSIWRILVGRKAMRPRRSMAMPIGPMLIIFSGRFSK